jgi:hypothetical protein
MQMSRQNHEITQNVQAFFVVKELAEKSAR